MKDLSSTNTTFKNLCGENARVQSSDFTCKESNIGRTTDQSCQRAHWLSACFVFLIVMLQVAAWGQSSAPFTTAGTSTWTLPAGVTNVTVEAWGGGGGGGAGGALFSTGRGGGGAGGSFTRANTPVSGDVSITVGAGGAGGTGTNNGSKGGTSSFGSLVSAPGGGPGIYGGNGNGAGAVATTGITYNGGAGAAATTPSGAGGGGGGAGNTGNGGGASGSTGGTAGTGYTGATTGGVGAAGRANNGVGNSATALSAGGGGGFYTGNWGNNNGGAGFKGQVIVYYYQIQNLAAATPVCSGSSSNVSITSSSLLAGVNYTVTYNLSAPNAANNLTASFTAIAGSGTFNVPSTALLSFGTTTVTINEITTGTYKGGIGANNTVDILVNPLPSVATGLSNQSRCGNGDVIFTVTDPGSDYSVEWSTDGSTNNDGSGAGGSGAVTKTKAIIIGSPITEYARISNDATLCKSVWSIGYIGTVDDLPTSVSTGTYGPVCQSGSPITLSGTGSPGIGVFSGTGVSYSAPNYIFTPTGSGGTSPVITYTVTNGSCSVSATTIIPVVSPPTVNAGSFSFAAINVPFTLNGSSATNYTSLEWSRVIGTGSFNNTGILHPEYTQGAPAGQAVTLKLTARNGICPDASATVQLLMVLIVDEKTWTGAVNSSWETSDNWSPDNGFIPSQTTNVTIVDATNDPIISSSAVCSNLTINSGVLTISSGKSLTVAQTLTNNAGNAGLVVKSGGSLIENTVGVAASVERTITKGTGQWHYVSVPNNNTTANTFLADYLIKWDETAAPGSGWSYIVAPSTPLAPAQGYGLWLSGATDKSFSFSGALNTGTQSKTITYSNQATSDNNGTNLLGNPYPSSIDWAGLRTTYGAIYYWNGTGYVSWNLAGAGSQYVPPMQGFFIVTAANGTFTLNNTNRTHNTAGFYKSASDIAANSLVLSTVGESYSDKLFVSFDPAATEGFDLQNDAYKFLAYSEGVSELYSFAGEKMLSIDARPECDEIQLGFRNTLSGEYQIGIDQIADIPVAFLEDTKTDTFHDLLNGPYKFSYTAGESEKRLILHFGTTALKETESVDAAIYSYQRTVHVNIIGQAKGDIFIYNSAGQLISTKVSARGMNEIRLPNTGVYIVKVVGASSTMVKKVWIQ